MLRPTRIDVAVAVALARAVNVPLVVVAAAGGLPTTRIAPTAVLVPSLCTASIAAPDPGGSPRSAGKGSSDASNIQFDRSPLPGGTRR